MQIGEDWRRKNCNKAEVVISGGTTLKTSKEQPLVVWDNSLSKEEKAEVVKKHKSSGSCQAEVVISGGTTLKTSIIQPLVVWDNNLSKEEIPF